MSSESHAAEIPEPHPNWRYCCDSDVRGDHLPDCPNSPWAQSPAASMSDREIAERACGVPPLNAADGCDCFNLTGTLAHDPACPNSPAAESRGVESANDPYAVEHPHGNWHVELRERVEGKKEE